MENESFVYVCNLTPAVLPAGDPYVFFLLFPPKLLQLIH